MKTIHRIFLILCLLVLTVSPALAESVSFTGQVTAAYAHDVFCDFTGTIGQVHVAAGDAVTADTPVATLRTTGVYAPADGVITAVFAQPGDSADALAARYGAALYLDDGIHYTVTVPMDDAKAYHSAEAQHVQPGEAVFLQSRTEEERTGTGMITAVTETDYTVEVLTGSFLTGETVNIHRTADFADAQRIGRGSIASKAPLAVTGTGCIVRVAVKAGDTVSRGDLLLETLEGGAAAANVQPELLAGAEGVVASLGAAPGAAAVPGTLVATIWPWDAMQIEALIPEADLGAIAAGDTVEIVFDWNQDAGQSVQGVVSAIACVNDASSETACYIAYINFTPDASVRYGMHATVTTPD